MKLEKKEKLINVLMQIYRTFDVPGIPAKKKFILAILAIVISVLITLVKIALR